MALSQDGILRRKLGEARSCARNRSVDVTNSTSWNYGKILPRGWHDRMSRIKRKWRDRMVEDKPEWSAPLSVVLEKYTERGESRWNCFVLFPITAPISLSSLARPLSSKTLDLKSFFRHHSKTELKGGHWGLRYCGIERFFSQLRYFGDWNFSVRYRGIIWPVGMQVFIL